MDDADFLSLVNAGIDSAIPAVLLIASIATLTGNYATKRLFDACGLGLRERYRGAVLMGVIGLAFLAGFRASHASTFLIGMLLILAALAWRKGSTRKSVTMTAFATLLSAAEIAA